MGNNCLMTTFVGVLLSFNKFYIFLNYKLDAYVIAISTLFYTLRELTAFRLYNNCKCYNNNYYIIIHDNQ